MKKLNTTNKTLLIVNQGGRILLGEKKKGPSKGFIDGVGGKQQYGESVEQAMLRNAREKMGITPTSYKLAGKVKLDVFYEGYRQFFITHIYTCDKFKGTPTETEKMIPHWYDKENLPYGQMPQDNNVWIEHVLAGEYVEGVETFDDDMNIVNCSFSFGKSK